MSEKEQEKSIHSPLKKKENQETETVHQAPLITTDPDREKYILIQSDSNKPIYKTIFWIISGLILFILPILSVDTGAIGDEKCQVPYSEMVLDFYLSFGKDRSCIEDTYCPTTYLYGGLFEITSASVNRLLGNRDIFDPVYHKTRHVVIAIFGFLAILFTGLLAKEIGGWRTGIFALIFITLTPRFLGHSLNNPKDIPFAASYIIAFYFIIRFLKKLPKPNWKDILFLIAGIAMGINIRVGGILTIAYLGLFLAWELFSVMGIKPALSKAGILEILKNIKYLAVICVGGFFGGVLFWPYGLISPLVNPFISLQKMSQYPINITILFDSEHIGSMDVPWYYIPKWMTISNPVYILLGFVLSFLMIFFLKKRYPIRYVLMTLFTVLFPVCYAIYKDSVLYDGWRHFLFIYPSFVVFSTLSYDYLFSLIKNKYGKIILLSCLLFMIILPVKYMIKNHPYEYVYFNTVFGGVDKAYGKYETDYYMNCIKEASEWLIKNENLKNSDDKEITIATNCIDPVKIYFSDLKDKVKTTYVRYYERNEKKWDYAIFYSRFTKRIQLVNKSWPPKGVIYTVIADNTPLCVVVKNENNSSFLGHEALKKEDYVKAKELFEDAVKYDPNNEDAYLNLGIACLYSGNIQDGISYIKKSLKILPESYTAYSMLGSAYLKQEEYDNAIENLTKAIEQNPRNPDLFRKLGIAFRKKGNIEFAFKCFGRTLAMNPKDMQTLAYVADIYKEVGKPEEAKKIMDRMKEIYSEKLQE